MSDDEAELLKWAAVLIYWQRRRTPDRSPSCLQSISATGATTDKPTHAPHEMFMRLGTKQ